MQEITYKQYISVTAMMNVLKLDENARLVVYFDKCYSSKYYSGQYSIIPLGFKIVNEGYEELYSMTEFRNKFKGVKYINVTSRYNRHFDTEKQFRKLVIYAKPKLYVARNIKYYEYIVENDDNKTLQIQLVKEHMDDYSDIAEGVA